MSRKKILIVSGEPSGDLHASNLVKDLKNLKPDLEFFGIGGALSKEALVDISFDMTRLSVVGLYGAWKNIFTIGRAFKNILKKVDAEKPDLAILVDYPGFNLMLAKEFKKRNIPVIYYISPQVWAWGKNRIEIIKECVEKIIVFFKFEEELYKRHGVNVEFVGHPLLETVRPSLSKDEVLKKYGLSKDRPVLALLPGSRKTEIKALLKVMTGAAKIIDRELGGVQVIVAKYKNLSINGDTSLFCNNGMRPLKVAEGDAYNILSAADFAIVASGTATLETAIIGTPFIITYKSNFVDFVAYKIVAKIKVLGLVNVIAGRVIVPEFLQYDATPENLAKGCLDIMRDETKKSAMIAELKAVKNSLGAPGRHLGAAKAILPYIS